MRAEGQAEPDVIAVMYEKHAPEVSVLLFQAKSVTITHRSVIQLVPTTKGESGTRYAIKYHDTLVRKSDVTATKRCDGRKRDSNARRSAGRRACR